MANLNAKQRRFAEEYVVDFNATQAAIRAGYSYRSAYSTGERLLRNAEVEAYVSELQEALAERTMITAEKVRKEYARLGFTNMRDFVEWGPDGVTLRPSADLSEDDSAAVTEVSESYGEHGKTLKFKLGHKDSALKVLAQLTGLIGRDGNAANVTVNVNNNTPPAKPLSDFTEEELDFYEKLLDTDSSEAYADRDSRA